MHDSRNRRGAPQLPPHKSRPGRHIWRSRHCRPGSRRRHAPRPLTPEAKTRKIGCCVTNRYASLAVNGCAPHVARKMSAQGCAEPHALLYAFDLLELNGTDLRREPIEVRKATLASLLPQSRHGVRLNEHGSASPGAWRQCPRSRVGRRAGKPSARSRAPGARSGVRANGRITASANFSTPNRGINASIESMWRHHGGRYTASCRGVRGDVCLLCVRG